MNGTRITFPGSRALALLGAALGCGAGAARAQPSYSFGFFGPDVLYDPDGRATAEYLCTLAGSGDGSAAQGWSMSLTAESAAITDITTAGTDVEVLFDRGFQHSELTSGPGNEGAVSAVGLSLITQVRLPANGTSLVARVRVEAELPPGGGLAALQYVDGRKGSGQPVVNTVTNNSVSFAPALGRKEIRLGVGEGCCEAQVDFGFSAEKVSSPVPRDGILDATDRCVGLGGRIEASAPLGTRAEPHVYVDISSRENHAQGKMGWSISIEAEGSAEVESATTSGTAFEKYMRHGFEQTEVVDPARNDGRRGVVSAVVLGFAQPAQLPATGTETVLDILLRASRPQPTFGLLAAMKFTDGLRASNNTPFNNDIQVAGNLIPACSRDLGRVEVLFLPSPALFIRGNANDDRKVNIADAVWIINDLFLGGPPAACPDAADADDDGRIGLTDAVVLLRHQFLGQRPPSAPFPGCGTDPGGDADGIACDATQTLCDQP